MMMMMMEMKCNAKMFYLFGRGCVSYEGRVFIGQKCRAYDVYCRNDFGAETSRGNSARALQNPSYRRHARGNGTARTARA